VRGKIKVKFLIFFSLCKVPFYAFPHLNSLTVRSNEYLHGVGGVSQSESQPITLSWSEFLLQSEPWEQQFLK